MLVQVDEASLLNLLPEDLPYVNFDIWVSHWDHVDRLLHKYEKDDNFDSNAEECPQPSLVAIFTLVCQGEPMAEAVLS